MVRWIPELMVITGILLGGISLFQQEKGDKEVPRVEPIPGESSRSNDCGAISLYLICRINETPSSLDEIRKLTRTSVIGTSMFDLKKAAEARGFQVRGVRCSFETLWRYLSDEGHYAILYFNEGHFAPAVQTVGRKIRMIDTRRLNMRDCSEDDLSTMMWIETALFLKKKDKSETIYGD